MDQKNRCFGNDPKQTLYAKYHDEEWGVPVYDDKKLFEMLILEGAQAGLSWETVLKKREFYRKAFYHFDPIKVAAMTEEQLQALLQNPGLIRNRLKIASVKKNALVFLSIQKEKGSFSDYVWSFVANKPISHHVETLKELPTTSPESDLLSKDLRKRGMSFVGSTIIYAFMQAVGMVRSHIKSCWLYKG